MAKARALDKRRKSIRNIRKITRTMELIATARFKKAMDRAHAATAYTKRITQLVSDLANSGLEVSHPLLKSREKTERGILLVLTANRGLCGGFNSNVVRLASARWNELTATIPSMQLEVSGKRGIGALRYRGFTLSERYTHFEDKVTFEQVNVLANRYLAEFAEGTLDRLDVAYMQFHSVSKQVGVVETLLPLGALMDVAASSKPGGSDAQAAAAKAEREQGHVPTTTNGHHQKQYEFLPSAASILEEVVPTSFKVKLFKCFLDAAVSEQVARMIAMKGATESASDMIKNLSRDYNRARQSQITGEIMEILGGVEALKG